MHVISVDNVNDAYLQGMQYLKENHVREESRAGDVMVSPEPVTTRYANPSKKVLFHHGRRANPFFHLMEGLWMLAGRNDVEWLSRFNKRMKEFSDDGDRFHGAYGARLRCWESLEYTADGGSIIEGTVLEIDQLEGAIHMLKDNPDTRRVVCSIWDPYLDLNVDSKDIPCNDMLKFEVRNGKVNMYIFNRSNDIVWGAYGANAVHFAMIMEYVTYMSGYEMGVMYQISTNYHAYVDIFEKKFECLEDNSKDFYREEKYKRCPFRLVHDPESFDEELNSFIEGGNIGYTRNPFLSKIAIPMHNAWQLYKEKKYSDAQDELNRMPIDSDWRQAGMNWINRISVEGA